MKLRVLFLFALFISIGADVLGQNDFYFNQFATIRYLSNPAELSFNKQNGAYLFRRDQWLNSPVKSSHLSILTGQYNLNRNVDLGLALTQYSSGNVFSNNSLQGIASWKGRLDKRSNRYFSIGTNVRLGGIKSDFSNSVLTDLNDPSIPQTTISQFFWDIGVGGNFKYDGFNFGISANSLKAFSSNYTSNYVYSRSILYNVGYNFNDALNAKSFNRPIAMLRIRAIDNAFAQGELILDQRIFSNTAYKVLFGLGIRRDLTNGAYNSIIMHLGIFWGQKTRVTLGFGPETFTAPVNTASSGNMEYLFGVEQTSKSDQFYGYFTSANTNLYQTNWEAAKSEFAQAQKLFPNDKQVSEKIILSDELEKKWKSIEQSSQLAKEQYKNQDVIHTKLTCEKALNELATFDSISKAYVNPRVVSSKKTELTSLLNLNNYLQTAISQFEQAQQLFEQKEFAQAIDLFKEAKRLYKPEQSEEYISKCLEGIEIQKEEKLKAEALQLEVELIGAYVSGYYEDCILLADQYLATYPYNTNVVLDMKRKAIEAKAKQDAELKIARIKEHFELAKKYDVENELQKAIQEIQQTIEEDPGCDSCLIYQKDLESRWAIQSEQEFQKHLEKGDYYFSIRAYKQALTEYRKAQDYKNTDEAFDKIEDCNLQIGNVIGTNGSSMQTIYNNFSDCVVMVYAHNTTSDMKVFGSGFFIKPDGTGITNYHVIEGCDEFYVHVTEDKMYYVEIIDYNSKEDWAVFKIGIQNGKRFPYLKCANKEPLIGEKVYSIGYPLVDLVYTMTGELTPTISEGNVNSNPTSRVIQNSCEINHGNSGGPLLNSRGEVVGITTWGLKADESGNLKYAINILSLPIKYIR